MSAGVRIIKEFCLTFPSLSFTSVLRTLLSKDYLSPEKKCHTFVVVYSWKKMELHDLGSIINFGFGGRGGCLVGGVRRSVGFGCLVFLVLVYFN